MKLIGKHRKAAEQTGSRDASKEAVRKAGVRLEDDALDRVGGGQGEIKPSPSMPVGQLDHWCTDIVPNGPCPYNATPNSDYCKGCPNRK